MTDTELDLLVTFARSPRKEREALPASRVASLASGLRSSTAKDVLSLLRGNEAKGTAATAWLTLVRQEATRMAAS